jgi:hypothetical protein
MINIIEKGRNFRNRKIGLMTVIAEKKLEMLFGICDAFIPKLF